ncbi:MAG: SRPBCC family protein [Actinomycetota bacterium]|nr:SRPBCC family protein [Actinomycetota bacterium]
MPAHAVLSSRTPPLPAVTGGIVIAEATTQVAASPDAVWSLWLDVAKRPLWHPRLEWARLDSSAAIGSRGQWKPERTRPVSVEITVLEPQRRLVLRGTHGPPVARGHYEHELAPITGGGSLLTHRMRLTGPLARPIGRLLGGALGVFATPAALTALAAQLAVSAERKLS